MTQVLVYDSHRRVGTVYRCEDLAVIAILGAVVLLTAGREKKNIFSKLTSGLGALYGVTGYVSDILSYTSYGFRVVYGCYCHGYEHVGNLGRKQFHRVDIVFDCICYRTYI